MNMSIYKIVEANVDGCGSDAFDFVQFNKALSKEEEQELKKALNKAKKTCADLSTGEIIEEGLLRFGKFNGKICAEPYIGTIDF